MTFLKWAGVVLGGLVTLGVVLYVVGLFIPVAHVASSAVRLRQPVDSIWQTVRALGESASWWPAVSAMERLPDRDGREVWLQRQTTGDCDRCRLEADTRLRGLGDRRRRDHVAAPDRHDGQRAGHRAARRCLCPSMSIGGA